MDELKKFFFRPKIIFIILGIVILTEVAYAVKVLTSSVPTAPLLPAKTTIQKTAGTISLTVSKTTFSLKEMVPVSIMVDTAGKAVEGVDLIVNFDPNILEATPAGLIKGKIFDEYPLMSVDSKKGLISISGISDLKNGFTGKGQFATLNLKAKVVGKTSLTIDFKKNSTTDSNMVEDNTSQDILENVDNIIITIQ